MGYLQTKLWHIQSMCFLVEALVGVWDSLNTKPADNIVLLARIKVV